MYSENKGCFVVERVLNQDERIRRAEELYARRKMQNEIRRSATVNVQNKGGSDLTKKLIIQCAICILIYSIFWVIKNTPNYVSQDVMYKISDILEYDINVQKLYDDVKNYLKNQSVNTEETNNVLVEETLSVTEEQNNESTIEINDKVNLQITENENVAEYIQEQQVEENIQLSQMEIDAQYIKTNFSIIKPLEGEITSRFGWRNPSIPTVPKNHTGIDIARVQGTVIISAMDGTVELVSSEGDLRQSCKNSIR